MTSVGYGWLISRFALRVPAPYKQSFLTAGAIRSKEIAPDGEEEYFPARYLSEPTWQGHLLFALRHEGIDPSVLKALFQQLPEEELVEFIRRKKTSVALRRVWFFYEFLLNKPLPIPPIRTGNYDYVLDPEEYFVLDEAAVVRARRQRLICNLPGNADFFPIVRLTGKIKAGLRTDHRKKLATIVNRYPAEFIDRANQFLFLKETKSSYAIEHQTPNQRRIAAFVAILRQAGRRKLTKELLLQLQNAIVDERYAESDYRRDQVYVGQTMTPGHEFVHFIGARPRDVPPLMAALLETADRLTAADCHPLVVAAVISFAFVFIHPFDDGNGRIHRYLMHHLLAEQEFCPRNIIFPVSAVLYKDVARYDRMLESFSRKLMPLLDYRLDDAGVMTVMNDTADYYRYINFTAIVEGFIEVVDETLKTELLPELDYLVAWERARKKMRAIVDLPEQKAVQMIQFVQQNRGEFPKRRRHLFGELSDEELNRLTAVIRAEILGRSTKK